MERIKTFIKKEAVLCIAAVLAVVSMFFVPPDGEYPGYIDFRTLCLLFSLMTVVAGFRDAGTFSAMSHTLLRRVHSSRGVVLCLTLICFFSSMLITNDVALLTFVPLSILHSILHSLPHSIPHSIPRSLPPSITLLPLLSSLSPLFCFL